jgi:hypothetical protein
LPQKNILTAQLLEKTISLIQANNKSCYNCKGHLEKQVTGENDKWIKNTFGQDKP